MYILECSCSPILVEPFYFVGVNTPFFTFDKGAFDEIYTTFSPKAIGNGGGAIFFDSTLRDSSITLISSKASNVYTGSTGGVLCSIGGNKNCNQNITNNQFKNVLARAGSTIFLS